jgi:hypothetical protein
MHAPVAAALVLALQGAARLDSAEVARVLAQLKASDSTVCELAGQALTNFGGWWRRDSNYGMAMPRPMPTPMPGGGGAGHIASEVMRAHRGGPDDPRWARSER